MAFWRHAVVWLYARRLASDLLGQICCVLLLFFLATVLQRLKPDVVGEEEAGFSIFNKAFCCCRFVDDGPDLGAAPLLFLLLAGCGGRSEKGQVRVASGVDRRHRELLEFRLPSADTKRRRSFAAAIQGHRADHAVLGSWVCRCFFLQRRIFSYLGAPIQAPSGSSGVVPDSGWSGCYSRRLAGGAQGSDCFFAIFSRVCFVKSRTMMYFLFSLRVLSVRCTPTA